MTGNKIIASAPYSELRQFAGWFHQDCYLIFPTFEEGLKMYMSTLTPERKVRLGQELEAFLKKTDGLPDGSTARLWRKKGADNWLRRLKTRKVLQEILASLTASN